MAVRFCLQPNIEFNLIDVYKYNGDYHLASYLLNTSMAFYSFFSKRFKEVGTL